MPQKTAAAWEELRQRREVRAGVNRLVNFDDANLRRSAQAAVAACARVERALEILADEVPDHLRVAGELRLAHRDASLDELGHHADPPLTKDAVAGRIRRLLAMADKRPSRRAFPAPRPPCPSDSTSEPDCETASAASRSRSLVIGGRICSGTALPSVG